MSERSKMNERLHDLTLNGWTVKDEWKVTWHDTKWVDGQRWMKGLHDMTPNGWTVKDEWKVYMTRHQMSERSKMNERFTWHDTKWVDGQRWMKGLHERTPKAPIWCHVMLTFHSSLTIHPFGVMSCNLATSHLVSCHVTFHSSLTVHPFGVMSCKPFIHLWPSTHLVSCHVTFHSSLTVHPFGVMSHKMKQNGWKVKDEWKVTWHDTKWLDVKDEWKVTRHDTKWVNGQRWMKGLHDMTPNGWTVKDEWKVTWHDTKWVNGQRWMKGYMTWHQMGCC
jgi:hypothetical protein